VTNLFPPGFQELLELQHGVFARRQAVDIGLGARTVDSQLRSARWQVLYRGVYAAFSGPPPRKALLWGGVLRAGAGAALSHTSAAEVDQLSDRPSDVIHVMISSSRRVGITRDNRNRQGPRIVIHYSARADAARHPSRTPPRTRIEETTIDLTQTTRDFEEALSWVIRACSRGLTTTELLLSAIDARPKLQWRSELADALDDVGEGVHSKLEWRYVREVERPHGLPRAKRQAPSKAVGRKRYFDNHYEGFYVVVELDGKAAHPVEARWSDIHRDNVTATAGIVTLRYSWADVTLYPCEVATEIAAVLRSRGWKGRPHPCSPDCPARLRP
jgi:very-short-patch-repair endonuclease